MRGEIVHNGRCVDVGERRDSSVVRVFVSEGRVRNIEVWPSR